MRSDPIQLLQVAEGGQPGDRVGRGELGGVIVVEENGEAKQSNRGNATRGATQCLVVT